MNAGVLFVALFVSLLGFAQTATALEGFATERGMNPMALENANSPGLACADTSTPPLLTLETVIARILCQDPQTRQAWAEAMAQAAQVGVAQAAFLPSLSASTTLSRGRNETRYSQSSDDSTQERRRQLDNRLSLSWILFDFGRREAALRNAQQLLIAANANQDSHLQNAFMQAAQLYYDTLAAQDSARTAHQVTKLAAENLKDASAKYEAGAAALSDRLQAQTAYSQARLSELRGEGAVLDAKGRIALRMGMSPQTPLALAGTLARRPDTAFVKSLDTLLEQARSDHPSLTAAKARVEAAKAAVSEREAAGRPNVSFIASLSDIHTRQHTGYYGDSRVHDNSLGLQLSIPLFEGFEPTYQLRGARAKLQASEAELADVEQQVSLELWTNYQSLRVETQALENTAEWVQQATLALEVVQGRYRSGVGSMMELLNASTAYAAAEQQQIGALNSWHQARLRLAASLGHLGFWTL